MGPLVLALEFYVRLHAEDHPILDLAAAPHEVQQFWLAECNCDGHRN